MNINNLLNNETFTEDFFKFDASSSSRPVVVTWGGTGIHTVTGPTPFVDISKSFNTNSAGLLESIVHSVTLTGKVMKPSGVGGITNTVAGIVALEKLFKECSRATLEIKCDNQVIFAATGVSVKSMSFNKTNDNWVQSADYSIELEYKTGSTDDPTDQVEDRQESWSIEPVDDAIYTKFSKTVNQKSEDFNPNMKPRAPTVSNPVPGGAVGGGIFGSDNSIQIFNIPQFRITRRLSAKGLSPPPGRISNTGQCFADKKQFEAQRKGLFLSAKAWVDKQTSIPFNGSRASGAIYFTNSPSIADYKGTWLYNHTRTISADIYNGTYEANDTWIAMPTGIPYIETFTIEASTDNENVKTVRVAGNIQGLSLTPMGIMTGSGSPLTTGNSTNSNIPIDLSYSLQNSPTSPLVDHKVPSLPNNQPSHINRIDSTKYMNALEAWVKDIKPYLYRRACLAINTSDRVPPPYNDPEKPPPNSVYLLENLLNVNPITTSEGHDPLKGTISYNHEFNNKLQIISGVLSENIRIANTAPANNIQETQILGRALGPLLSSAGVTNPRKTISVDIVVPKATGIKATLQTEPECPLYYKGYFWNTVNTIIQGNEPFSNRTNAFFQNASSQQYGTVFKDSDSEDWNPTEGRYTRSVSWIYQHCTTDRFYLDH